MSERSSRSSLAMWYTPPEIPLEPSSPQSDMTVVTLSPPSSLPHAEKQKIPTLPEPVHFRTEHENDPVSLLPLPDAEIDTTFPLEKPRSASIKDLENLTFDSNLEHGEPRQRHSTKKGKPSRFRWAWMVLFVVGILALIKGVARLDAKQEQIQLEKPRNPSHQQ